MVELVAIEPSTLFLGLRRCGTAHAKSRFHVHVRRFLSLDNRPPAFIPRHYNRNGLFAVGRCLQQTLEPVAALADFLSLPRSGTEPAKGLSAPFESWKPDRPHGS